MCGFQGMRNGKNVRSGATDPLCRLRDGRPGTKLHLFARGPLRFPQIQDLRIGSRSRSKGLPAPARPPQAPRRPASPAAGRRPAARPRRIGGKEALSKSRKAQAEAAPCFCCNPKAGSKTSILPGVWAKQRFWGSTKNRVLTS